MRFLKLSIFTRSILGFTALFFAAMGVLSVISGLEDNTSIFVFLIGFTLSAILGYFSFLGEIDLGKNYENVDPKIYSVTSRESLSIIVFVVILFVPILLNIFGSGYDFLPPLFSFTWWVLYPVYVCFSFGAFYLYRVISGVPSNG
jgi:hypothetical protein